MRDILRLVARIAWRALAAATVAGGCKVADKHPDMPDAGAGDAGGPVDTRAPDTRIDQSPAAFSNSGQATFRFSSDEPGATFECRVDDEAAQPCQSPYVRTLPDGPHSFSVRAVDPAGNGDDTPAERVWTIDTVPPDTILLTGPPAADNSVAAQFTFRSSEDNVGFDCSIDNTGYLPCTSGQSFALAGDGPHSFAVRAHDRAGNLDASPAIYAWTVDTRTPDTQILEAPPAASQSTAATFSFVSPDAGAGATFQCSLDGAAFTACSSPQAYSGLPEAAHSFAVRVRDAVGNLDPTPATRSWTVDLTPPDTAITAGPSNTVPIASASLSFVSSEPDSTFSCSLDAAPFTACSSPAPLTGLAQGMHTFAVRATDAAGHDDPSPATRTWTVDTVAPDIAITAGPGNAATSGPRVVFGFTVSDGAVVCSVDGAPFAACASPFAIAPNLPAGPHQFAVRATDAAGNATTMARSWTVVCSPPDATGAAALLHLDDTGQTLANAVAGGAPATLGDTPAVEPGDPAALPGARFGGGLAFTADEGDHVTWPVALPAMPELTIELWARPAAPAGPRDLLVSSDGRVALRVIASSPMLVQFSIAVTDGGPGGATHTASSAAVAAGAWHHVLVSLQAPALRLWVDGARTETDGVAPGGVALDAIRLGGAAAYDGALDEVWLAQTAITSDDAALGRYCPL
jgi:concanavalin A-like lectin/glucanase superfamily protein